MLDFHIHQLIGPDLYPQFLGKKRVHLSKLFRTEEVAF